MALILFSECASLGTSVYYTLAECLVIVEMISCGCRPGISKIVPVQKWKEKKMADHLLITKCLFFFPLWRKKCVSGVFCRHGYFLAWQPTCSMTSGAIQHGVPTNVLRTLFRVMSPPVARKALTPKSEEREGEIIRKTHTKACDAVRHRCYCQESSSSSADEALLCTNTPRHGSRAGGLTGVNEVTAQLLLHT